MFSRLLNIGVTTVNIEASNSSEPSFPPKVNEAMEMNSSVRVILSSNDEQSSQFLKAFSNSFRGEVTTLRVSDESISKVVVKVRHEKKSLGKTNVIAQGRGHFSVFIPVLSPPVDFRQPCQRATFPVYPPTTQIA